MKKTFSVFASETVYYYKEVEADSPEEVKQMIFEGEIDFDYGDITDGFDFQVNDIEEYKRYA